MIKEIAIAARDFPNARRGDVLVCRNPLGHIGSGEDKDFIWMLADVPSEGQDSLADTLTMRTTRFKRRYAIPFERLIDFDSARALDRQVCYQPFVQLQNGNFKARPLLQLGMAKSVPDIRALLIDKTNQLQQHFSSAITTC